MPVFIRKLTMTNKAITNKHQKSLAVLGQYFRELRLNNGLTQHELSADINVHLRTIQRLEAGRNVTMITVLTIADYFEINALKELIDIK